MVSGRRVPGRRARVVWQSAGADRQARRGFANAPTCPNLCRNLSARDDRLPPIDALALVDAALPGAVRGSQACGAGSDSISAVPRAPVDPRIRSQPARVCPAAPQSGRRSSGRLRPEEHTRETKGAGHRSDLGPSCGRTDRHESCANDRALARSGKVRIAAGGLLGVADDVAEILRKPVVDQFHDARFDEYETPVEHFF